MNQLNALIAKERIAEQIAAADRYRLAREARRRREPTSERRAVRWRDATRTFRTRTAARAG